ncbi:hypothetical protein A2U01_0108771, partial [Trifolium medium]|nr:hypothetical protein [Trifolium medium]
YVARCAGLGTTAGFTSGCRASRSLGWRAAPLKQEVESNHLEVARRAVWVGATRHYKIQS